MRCFALLLLLLLTLPVWAVDTEKPLADPAQRALYENLINEARCLVCQNETIADSNAPLAADLRREIRRMVAAGQDEQQVRTFLLQRYGDFVLYRPRFQYTTALLWLAPLLLLAIVALTLFRVLRRRARLPADVDADERTTQES